MYTEYLNTYLFNLNIHFNMKTQYIYIYIHVNIYIQIVKVFKQLIKYIFANFQFKVSKLKFKKIWGFTFI